ncbi:hypothetical protein RhiirB3_435582 [Rhizophagus irregularis]|nr:hypothetical protein RhiirB3_435582 [Rhizophagus irregularis]
MITIDRNIRKALKRPIQYRLFEFHLTHKSLRIIRKFALHNLINWEFTQLWMQYNPFDRLTSLNLKWIIDPYVYGIEDINEWLKYDDMEIMEFINTPIGHNNLTTKSHPRAYYTSHLL